MLASTLLFLLLLVCSAVPVRAAPLANITTWIDQCGYSNQMYTAATPDGYELQLLRVRGRGQSSWGQKGAVILQHGLSSCCADWFLNFPTESLGFLLADMGYDVWAGNNRGNGYSMTSVDFSPDELGFWNFTWDDMAAIDLPTEVDFVLNTSGFKTLSYMGISQGTAQVFSGLSENPELASKFNLFVAFAPVAYVSHQRSVLMKVLAELDLDKLVELFYTGEFDLSDAVRSLLPDVCAEDPAVCEWAFALEVGPSVNLNTSRLPFFTQYEIAPTSVYNVAHWAQGARQDVFQRMDWGTEENQRRYNQPTPPPYDLTNFPTSLPVALFTGGEDYLADGTDVKKLVSLLPRKPVLIKYEPTYSHIDYVISTDANQQIYPDVYNLLSKYASSARSN